MKSKNDPIILAIPKYNKTKIFHSEEEVNIGRIQKTTLKLDKSKALQKLIFPLELLWKIFIYFAEILCRGINSEIRSEGFDSS